MKLLGTSLLQMFWFYNTVSVFLFLVLQSPELWMDETEDEDDEEILLFFTSLLMTCLRTHVVFLKLCQILEIYNTRPRDLLFQYGNYPRE